MPTRYAALACVLLCVASSGFAQAPLRQERAGFVVTLRVPDGGLVAGTEVPIEFRLERQDRVPVLNARVRVLIDMPDMPGMARFEEIAHTEGVPGDYGFHPTFPHGGSFRLTLMLLPPDQQPAAMSPKATEPFSMQFDLSVSDAGAPGESGAAAVSRYGLRIRPQGPLVARATSLLDLVVIERGVARTAADGSVQVGEAPVREFDIAHERAMHLFVVREDLGVFLHEHPLRGPFGMFRAELRLPTAGRYRLFADVAPARAGSQILTGDVVVEGSQPSPAFNLAAEAARQREAGPQMVDGTRVRWEWNDPIPAQRTVSLVARLETPEGGVVSDLEPYLGAMGHLMLLHEDGATFVHSHPDALAATQPGATTVVFLARFPKSGLYRGWGQFQRAGKLLTADFVVSVP